MMVCSLCHNDLDSHTHLIFKCDYAKAFWDKVMCKMGMKCEAVNGNEIVSWFANQSHGNNIDSIVYRLEMAASVYLIWQERNFRMFKEERRGVEELYKAFEDIIKLRLLSLKTKPSKAVFVTQSRWNIKMNIVSKVALKGKEILHTDDSSEIVNEQ